MLIDCPECTKPVSSLASACPTCGYPVREQLEARRAADELATDRTSRRRDGELPCPFCNGRGFEMIEPEEEGERALFAWCERCEHTGRIPRVVSPRGSWAVAATLVERFVAGELDEHVDLQFVGEV
ncbi:MAG: hypothetical protein MUE69_15135 [Myxococcota bacterium]|nr:hypothetical protein [Myxococcota bacterium]